MKKVIMALLLVVFCMSLFGLQNERVVPTTLLTGSGSELDPYLIEDYADLVTLSTTTAYWGTGIYIKQTADIDATNTLTLNGGEGLSTIGINTLPFSGNYDGQGYEISNLFISRVSAPCQGLFGQCDGATITDVSLVNCNVTGLVYTGGLIGEAKGTTSIENCNASGQVNGSSRIGGLIGNMLASSSISNCHASVVVSSTVSDAGGLVAWIQNSSTISNSYATGLVEGIMYVGGLVGTADTKVTINNSFATGKAKGTEFVGGFAGYLSGSRNNHTVVSNCFATGEVEGDENIAGFCSRMRYANINYCYSTGLITSSSTSGGFVSLMHYPSYISNSFWNTTTAGVATSLGGIGKTTSEMQTLATFTNAGWDFVDETVNGEEDIWSIDSAKNDGYPYLSFAQNYFQYVPVCPHVTGMLPENGSINVQPDDPYNWDAIPEVAGYTRGYEITINNETFPDQAETSFSKPDGLEYSTENHWSVKPYYMVDGSTEKIYPDTAPEVYNFYTVAGLMTETPNEENPINWTMIFVPEGATPFVPAIMVTLPTEGYAYQPLFALTYNFEVTGSYIIYIGAPYIDGSTYHVFIGGRELELGVEWEIDEGIFAMLYDYEDSKGDVDIVITNDDVTLPVELSSFNAVITSANYAQINWETASESNLIGYNIYRNESENSETALRVNPNIIAANNYATGSKYSFVDSELETETTYYYWLESLELSNENNLYGPVTVTIEDEAVVEGVTITQFNNFGPSPFTESTTSALRVKEGETASVTIYNLLGQVVSRESFNAGEHNFTFNGRDLNNKKVANGIYFVKMSSPSASKSFKIVKIK